MPRTFQTSEAERKSVPLLIGLFGPSGSGKTMSALELATGIQRVAGGKIDVIDTENGRALLYADYYKFRHTPLDPPYGSLDYLACTEHATQPDTSVLVIDNASHEHEGEGGLLLTHEAKAQELAKRWKTTREKAGASAWAHVKPLRQKLISHLTRMRIHVIVCFRAKDKLDWDSAKPEKLGFMPVTGDDFIYEMTACGLLMPGSDGVPDWNPKLPGAKAMVKKPKFFRELIAKNEGRAISADFGEAMARWAAGDPRSDTHEPYMFPKGEHKGDPITAVPTQYLADLLKRSPPGRVAHLVQSELERRRAAESVPQNDDGPETDEFGNEVPSQEELDMGRESDG